MLFGSLFAVLARFMSEHSFLPQLPSCVNLFHPSQVDRKVFKTV